ncbi:MAG: hypothetical protein ACLU98_09855 [Desulfovibrio fairfieldensis]
MLTKGAIGNLVNKYRAVLKKCGLLNVFGSLALAGALTVGAAGMAGATSVNWGDSVVTISSGTETISTRTDTVATSITIENGGSLTLGSQGQDLWTTPGAGAADFSGPTITIKDGGVFTSSGGALQGIVPHDPWNYHGTLDAQQGSTITLSNGGSISALDITLNGTAAISGQLAQSPHPDNGAWRKGAIYAGHDLTVGAHGKITLGDNGLIGAGTSNGGDGQQVNIQGSVKMTGSAQNSASVIRATGDAALNISGTVGVDTSKYGVIAAPVTNVDGGSIVATGTLEMVATLPDEKNANAMTVGTAGATFRNGELNLANGGRLKAEAVAVKGGVINITGGVKGNTYQTNGRSISLDAAGNSGSGADGRHGQRRGRRQH